MIVAIMFVGVVFVNAKTSAASTCSITSTLRLGSKGTQVACLQSTFLSLTADGNFGPKTQVAVKAWQATKGLVADGVFGPMSRAAWEGSTVTATLPVGCQSTAGFSASTGLPCNSATVSTYPAGCVSASGFSPTTGASCSTGVAAMTYPAGCTSALGYSPTTGASCSTGATTVVNSTGAGNISSDGLIGGFNNTIVGVGDVNHQVAGFQLTGAGGGSNLNLNYATVQLTNVGSDSSRLADYVSSVSIIENGVTVGTVPSSAFSATNSSGAVNDIYSASFPLTGATVTAGQTSNFYIAITANSSIDSANFSAIWEVAVNSVRFTDGTGLTLSYSPSSGGIGSLSVAKEFTFGSAASANNIIVNVGRASSDMNAHTVTVNATGNTTQKVPLLAFTISDQGGQTVSVNKLPITLTSSASHVSSLTPEVYLMQGSTVLDSENVNSTACTTTSTCPIYFKNFSTPLLVTGSPVTLTVAADINAVGAGTTDSNYVAGTYLTATTLIGSSTGWDLSVGSPSGTEISTITTTIIPGTANGQQVAFYATGVSVAETSDVCTANNNSDVSSTSSLSCVISYSVTANGAPEYIPKGGVIDTSTTGTGLLKTGINFAVEKSGANNVTSNASVSVSQNGTNATSQSATEWVIPAGTTANFTATVVLTDPSNAAAGQYRALLSGVAWSATDTGSPWTNSYTFNLNDTNTVVPGYTYIY